MQTPNLNLGELMVMTKGGEARERVLAKIQELFDNDFPLVRGRVNRLENGPPVGYPVQFRVSGRTTGRCRRSPTRWPRSCAPTRTSGASTRTGASG